LRKNKPYRRFDRLKPVDVHNEWILLQLRTKDGFSLEGLREREGDPALAAFLCKIEPLKKRDLLVEENGRVLIPPSLYFVSDQIIRESLLP
jgi:coproporphyrinogen III oxidase-like Fe-S oxidoreductase